MGEVYERLIEDVAGDDLENIVSCLMQVYSSWMDAALSNYNTDFYYQSRDYIYECYKEGKICA
jgi:DNA-binding ferritin-like protein (Dps family)